MAEGRMTEKYNDVELYQRQEKRPLPVGAFVFTKTGMVWLAIVFIIFLTKGLMTAIFIGLGLLIFIYRQIEPDVSQINGHLLNAFFVKKAKKERENWKSKGWRIERQAVYVKNGRKK